MKLFKPKAKGCKCHSLQFETLSKDTDQSCAAKRTQRASEGASAANRAEAGVNPERGAERRGEHG